MNPKYILLKDGSLVIGRAEMHMDMHQPNSEIKSGGWWALSKDNETLILYKASIDFGAAMLDDILLAFEKDSLLVKRMFRQVTSIKHTYFYELDREGMLPELIMEWEPLTKTFKPAISK